MSYILQLETSTTSCSVSLAFNGETIALKEVDERNAHAGNLTLFIEEVMVAAGKKMTDLEAVAVSKGPGSYTGLRIGVSTAKGLCYALDIPLIAVNTLEAMANGFKPIFNESSVFFCPMIDARRMEVYAAVYNQQFNEVLPLGAMIIDENSFSDILSSQKIVFFGDGAIKCQEILLGQPNAIFYPDFINSAKHLDALAFNLFRSGTFEDVAYFEPFYLKDFVATQPKPRPF